MSANSHDHQPNRRISRRLTSALVVIAILMCATFVQRRASQRNAPPSVSEFNAVDPQVNAYLKSYMTRVEAEPRDANARAQLGIVLAANHLWAAAHDAFEQAVRLDSQQPLAYYYMGVSKAELGDAEAAIAVYRTVTNRFPTFAPAFQSLADALLQQGQLAKAKDALLQSTALAPSTPHGYIGLADVELRRGNIDAASMMIEKAIDIAPRDRHARYVRGLVYRHQGRRQEALREMQLGVAGYRPRMPDDWTDDLRRHDRSVTALITQARNHLQQNQIDAAAAIVRSVVKWHPNNIDAILALATVHQTAGDRNEALRLATQAYRMAPDSSDVITKMLFCHEALNHRQQALEFGNRLVEVDPNTADSYYLRARALRKFEDLAPVLDDLRQAIRLDPTNALLLNESGIVLLRMQRYAEAKQDFEQALHQDASNVLSYLNLAVACRQLGQIDNARNALRNGLKHAPEDKRIKQFLAELASQSSDSQISVVKE